MLVQSNLSGQVVADFNFSKENPCLLENVKLENLSTNASRNEWDFCPGDFSNVPTLGLFVNRSEFANINGVTIYSDSLFSAERYVFVASRNNKQIYKYKLNENLDIPTSSPVGIIPSDLVLNQPISIDIVFFEGEFYGFFTDLIANKLYEIKFGSSLDNAPQSITDLGNFSSLNQPNSVKAVVDENKIKVLVSNFNTNVVKLIERQVDGTYTHANIATGNNGPWGIDVIKYNGDWILAVAFASINTVRFFRFEGNIDTSPENTYSFINAEMPAPGNVRFAVDKAELNAFVQSNNGRFGRVLFGATYNNSASFTDFGSLGALNSNTRGFSIVKNKDSKWQALIAQSNSVLNKISFPNNCSIAPATSNFESPQISYSQAGQYSVTLSAIHSNGNRANVNKEITVSENEAPIGSILTLDAFCINDEITFEFETEDLIADFLWHFDDGESSIEEKPIHQYLIPGTYTVELTVASPEGCENKFTKTITIYDEATPDFSTNKVNYCTFETITFDNLTIGDFGENISYLWDFNGEGSSIETNPNFSFQSSGTKTIRLTTNVLGCETFAEKTIELIDGPQVDFEVGAICKDLDINLVNLSVGSDITSYRWELDGEEFSTDENTNINFDQNGIYTIRLIVSNISGCENSTQKEIQIFDQIISDIEMESAVENLPFKTTLSLIEDQPYSIAFVEWEINGQTSNLDTPLWTLPEGIYEISVSIIVDAGCQFTFQKEISVLSSTTSNPNFVLEEEVCLNEQLQIENSSINAINYEWDFCPGDFQNAPTLGLFVNRSEFANVNGLTIYTDSLFSLDRYMFIASRNNKQIFKYKLNDQFNSPLVDPVGIIPSTITLNQPIAIDIVRFQDEYFGFFTDLNDNKLYEIKFGNSLDNTPQSITDLGNFSSLNQPNSVKAFIDEDKVKVLVSNFNTTFVKLIERQEDGSYTHSNIAVGNNAAWGIDLVRFNEDWVLGVAFASTNTLRFFKFEGRVDTSPESSFSFTDPELIAPGNLKFAVDRGELNGLVQSNNGKFGRVLFGDSYNQAPSYTDFGNLVSLNTATRGFSIVKNKDSKWQALIAQSSNIINKITFPNNCQSNMATSTQSSPTISFSQAGTYPITLTAIHPNGNRASITKEITVTNNEAPGIDFTFSGEVCEGALITLSPQATVPLASYSWDFGDGNVSDQEAPQHSFDSPGTYMVRLRVESEEGCSNFVEKSITIFPAPVAAFEIVGDLFCTFDPITFQNLTAGDYGELITWEWDFNGEGSSTQREPTYIFESPGEKTITLKAMIPGCEDLVSSQIVLVAGPNVNFEVEDICFGETATFNNLSTGEGITGYFWEFGDGYTSTLENPAHYFESPGEYIVTLRAGNANGCENTFQSTIKVSDLPVAEFSFELACSNAPIQFFDSSAAPNANLQQWLWEVKDMEGNTMDNSSNQNPIFNFSQGGNYQVSLTVFNNFGCEDVMTKTISVIQQPAVEVQKDIACAGFQSRVSLHVPELFVDSLVSITWLWRGQTLMQDDLVFNNLAAGTYPVQAIARFENRCELILTDEVTVPGLPEASFSFQVACPGEAVVFEGNGDNRASGLQTYWKLANDTLGVGNTYAWFPSAPGTYTIEMIVLNEEGCIATQSQSVVVPAGPRASFTISSNTGVSPFLPVITNTSERANQFVWRSGLLNQEDQEVLNPAFRYESPGRYKIELIAIDERGCSDTISAIIDVIQPVWSMALEGMNIIRTGELAEINLTLRNTGNVPVQNLEVEISFENATRFQETIRETFTAGTLQNYQLPVRLNLAQNPHISFICVTLKAPAGIPQNRLITPEACETIDPNAWKVADIYPNPATDFAKVDIILQEQSPLRLELVNATGNTLWRQQYPNPRPGLNAYDLDIKNLPSGLYFLIVHHRNETIRKRLVVR